MSSRPKRIQVKPKYSSKFSGGPAAASAAAPSAKGASPAAASKATKGVSASGSFNLFVLDVTSRGAKPSSTGSAALVVA